VEISAEVPSREECLKQFWDLAAALAVRYEVLYEPTGQADSSSEVGGGEGSQSG
jgi:hypothetical protein